MSYPRQLQTLIVEDDPKSKQLYDAIFNELRAKDASILAPRYAFSFDDGLAELKQPRMLHLVILDLCLPERRGMPAAVGVDFGMQLEGLCQKRDDYPIPALLIVTGNASKTEQTALRTRLEKGFWYAQLIVKGGDNLPDEIGAAITRVREYSDVGLHVHDSGASPWPSISPRDEDLLRRAALLNRAAGYDLRWWSAEYTKASGQHADFRGWTKTLMGTFTLGEGRGPSRPVFCKLMPAQAFDVVARDAHVLEQKLSHIKVKATVEAGARSLLITEKTGDGTAPPSPLHSFLSRPDVAAHVTKVANDVVSQTERLGEPRSDMVMLQTMLWPFHDETRLGETCAKHGPPASELDEICGDPLSSLARIKANPTQYQVSLRECLHGDLNVTNIAIDEEPDLKGYIFDASGVGSGPAMRDLANLEVTALLQLPPTAESVVTACGRLLYGERFRPEQFVSEASPRAVNTLALVSAIRAYAERCGEANTYALCVLDQVLIQVGGLTWPSGNKVSDFKDAVLLAKLVAGWIQRVAPSLLHSPGQSQGSS